MLPRRSESPNKSGWTCSQSQPLEKARSGLSGQSRRRPRIFRCYNISPGWQVQWLRPMLKASVLSRCNRLSVGYDGTVTPRGLCQSDRMHIPKNRLRPRHHVLSNLVCHNCELLATTLSDKKATNFSGSLEPFQYFARTRLRRKKINRSYHPVQPIRAP